MNQEDLHHSTTSDRQAGRPAGRHRLLENSYPGRVSAAGTGQQKTHILEALELLSKTLLPLTEESVRGTWDSKAEASVPSAAARSIRCSFRAGPHSGRGFISFLVHWEHTHRHSKGWCEQRSVMTELIHHTLGTQTHTA